MTDGVTHVLEELLEAGPAPGLAGFFLKGGGIAEGSQSGGPGLLSTHAGADILGNQLIEVELHLPVEFFSQALAEE